MQITGHHQSIGALCAAALVFACSDAETGIAPDAGGNGADAGSPSGDAGGEPDAGNGPRVEALENALMSKEHAKEQGYWYSRYTLMSYLMQSGNGETFDPPPQAVQMMVDMASDELSMAAVPPGVALLRRPFDHGDPHFAQAAAESPPNPMNFANFRWTVPTDTSTRTTSGSALGQTVMKIVEWAKLFHKDDHFGVPGSQDPLTRIPGAMQRFAGMALTAEAIMMTVNVMMEPARYDLGSDPEHMYVWLMALSDLGQMLDLDVLPFSEQPNRYKMIAAALKMMMGMPEDPPLGTMFLSMSDQMYEALPEASSLRQRAAFIKALQWYGAASATHRADVKTRIVSAADELANDSANTAVERAMKVRSLVSAWQVSGSDAHLDQAVAEFEALISDYDGKHGVFRSQSRYSPEDVAWIIGAINAVDIFAVDRIGIDEVDTMLTGFFESAVNQSGLIQSAPAPQPPAVFPYELLPSEDDPDELFHRYPTTPLPSEGDGQFGIAPTFATAVRWDSASNTWSVEDRIFDAADGFNLANEMIWLHADEVDGFPQIP